MNSISPRLQVLLASEVPVGVVLRRGPSKMVRLVMWNRETDRFKPLSWFKGRIFADRSDVSPDGRHMIYFAMGGVAWATGPTGGTWTAISRLPSLKAEALWGQGDTWGGGGFFTSKRSYWLDANQNTFLMRDNSGLRRDQHLRFRSRLERDGWVKDSKALRCEWVLRKLKSSGGYQLEHPSAGKVAMPDWEWAEWDRHRLVFAQSGCLREARLGSETVHVERTLCDFNVVA